MSTHPNLHSLSTPHAMEPADIGLRDYWNAIWGQRWLIVGITAAIVVLVLVATLLMTPEYRASSTLQIDRDSLNVVGNVESLMPVESPQDRDFYETQYELLQSRSLARAVIREANLADDPAFKPIVEKALEKVGNGPKEGDKAAEFRQDVVERALTVPVLKGLNIEPIRNSRLVRINYDSPDPVLSAKIANAYAKEFIISAQERRLKASSFASKYLSERLAQLRDRVEDSEKKLVAYSSQEQIVPLGDDKPSLPAQNLTELTGMLATAQNARIQAEAAWRQASGNDTMDLPQVVSNPLIQSLRTEKAKLSAEYRQKLATFKPQYPEMQQLQSQIDETQRQINREVVSIRNSIKAEYETAARQEQLLSDRIASVKNQELDLQSRSIRYNMLKRDADTNRQLYDALLQRYKEIGVAGNVGTNNISVVDNADIPGSPSTPRTTLNLAIGFIFGLFIAMAVALVRYFVKLRS